MPMVLLVDADPDSSVRFEKALRAAGYEVSVAPSGSRAPAMLRQRRPDLIISQAMFEDMYGSGVFHAGRSHPAPQKNYVRPLGRSDLTDGTRHPDSSGYGPPGKPARLHRCDSHRHSPAASWRPGPWAAARPGSEGGHEARSGGSP